MRPVLIALIVARMALPATAQEASGKTDAWSEDNAMKMSLALVDLPNNDLQRAVLRLTVINTSQKDLILDKELAAGFSLRFKTNLTVEGLVADEQDVTVKETRRIDKPNADAVRSRFVRLKPGQPLRRTYDLARPSRGVVEGHASDMNSVHYGFYYEAMQTYQIPPKVTRLTADAWYERGVWMMAQPQFMDWWGRSAGKIGLWDGRAKSDTLVIQKR